MEHSIRKNNRKYCGSEYRIYYQEHREKMEIDVIGEQKWSVILGIL